jgi:sodium-dependent phosphate cotransporter
MANRLLKAALVIVGLFVFILALEFLKRGAGSLAPLLATLRVQSLKEAVAFGWLMAYVVLSGSPVAAIALSLFSGNVITDVMSLGMITGSRLGASFIVLFVGFIYNLRGYRRVASISIGVLAWLVTATIYIPALALGYVILSAGWLDGAQFGSPAALTSVLDWIVEPIAEWVVARFPTWALFVVGVGCLLAAFRIFDRVLPQVDGEAGAFGNIANLVYRPMVMFLIGAAFTSLTLSVSVSLTLLVPLATRGYIRRENIIPYIMGANITTFIDTLFASLLLNTPRAFTVVLVEIITVGIFSLLAMLVFYRPYQRAMSKLLDIILRNYWTLGVFLLIIVGVPILLLLV